MEPIKLERSRAGWTHRIACCDCGLVHDIAIVKAGKDVFLIVKRNARATAAKRRKPTTKGDRLR